MHANSQIVTFSNSQATLLSSSQYRSIVGRGYDPNRDVVLAANGDNAALRSVIVSSAGVQDGGVLVYAEQVGSSGGAINGTARINFAIIWR